MSRQSSRPPATTNSVDAFLDQVAATPARREEQPGPDEGGEAGANRGRLLFALDATASRQPTWDRACALQTQMFACTEGIGHLDVQLCFYRGYREFRATPWHCRAAALERAGAKVRCRGGLTQIERVLRHALAEHRRQPLQAVVFIGDCLEEALDPLCALAGELGVLGLPLFLFQEGKDPLASRGFAEMARLSGGAHCVFDQQSPEVLAQLLQAVALYATGGKAALKRLLGQAPRALEPLRGQLEKLP